MRASPNRYGPLDDHKGIALTSASSSLRPTATSNARLAFRPGAFDSLPEALDYAARGETGCNFFTPRGELYAALTYREIRERAVDLAQRLTRSGIAPGSRVALIAETRPEFHVFFFGCQYAGLVPVPLPLSINLGGREAYVERLRAMIRAAGAQAAVASPDFIDFLREATAPLSLAMVGTPEDFLALPGGGELRPFGKGDPCYIQYSSGSTRMPRGVFISQSSITHNARGIAEHGLKLRPGDRSASWLPLYHDMGLVGFCLTPVVSQVTVDYLETPSFGRRPLTWLKVLSEQGSTVSFSPTFGYQLCLRRAANGAGGRFDLSNWRIAGIGGEMVRADVLAEFADCFAPSGFRTEAFLPSYGLAESTLAACFAPVGAGVQIDRIDLDYYAQTGRAEPIKSNGNGSVHKSRAFVVCGKPLPGHRIEIRDAAGRALGERQVGRIMIKGPSLMSGYFGDPAATREVMTSDGWLDTGDLGYMVDGGLVITGRSKDLIIYHGRNIWPQDIEWAVEKLDQVRSDSVAVFAAPSADGGEKVVVVVQCRLTDPTARRALAREVLAVVHKTAGVECEVVLAPTRSLTFTSSGKLSRAAARTDYLAGAFTDRPERSGVLHLPLAADGARGAVAG